MESKTFVATIYLSEKVVPNTVSEFISHLSTPILAFKLLCKLVFYHARWHRGQ